MNVVTMSGEIKFQGDVGPRGPKGEKGDKPVVGVDYFTEADRTHMVGEVTEDANSVFNQNVATKTNEFNNNVTSKTVDFNDNTVSKTNTYNQNAEDKTEAYDNNAINHLTLYNANASTKVSEFNTNSQNKVGEYDTNASTKLNAYNSNATQKETAFDNNAEEQTTTFNKNATTKTNTFNTNASTKTTAFNSNATNKTEAFDTHVFEKTTEFNANAIAQTNTFNTNVSTKTEEFNENAVNKTEEFNANYKPLDKRIDWLESIQDTSKSNGENVYFDNAKNYPLMSLKGEGKSEQITTTGKNLLPNTATTLTTNGITFKINDDKSITISGTSTAKASINLYTTERTLEAGSYTISTGLSQKIGVSLGIQIDDTYYSTDTSKLIELSANATFKKWYIDVESGKTVNTTIYPMLEVGTETTPYEPYTGLQPAPNPDYPQEIKTISEASYKGCGKQFFIMPASATKNGITYTLNSDGTFNISGTSTAVTEFTFYSNNLISNDIYTLSSNVTNTNLKCKVEAFENKNTWISALAVLSASNITKEIVIPENAKIIRYAITVESGVTLNISNGYIQLEKGNTQTEYEPYQESTVSIDLQGNELASVGTVSDKLLIDRKGNVAIEKNVGKVVLNGEANVLRGNNKDSLTSFFYASDSIKLSSKVISDYFAFESSYGKILSAEKVGITAHQTVNRIYFCVENEVASTVDEIKLWLAEHNTTVYYELATPELIPLGTIANPEIFKGVNNITVETNIGNMNVEVEYVEDLQLRIEKIEQAIVSLANV